jgi:response regulator RpfG family c-di-GMP phosphodiesterase
MKLVRTKAEPVASSEHLAGTRHRWKLLVVDDEPDMRELTRLNLKGFQFAERPLEIIEAASAYQARELLAQHDDIAVALIDVVMETDDAGLRLVEFIRKDLKNTMIRLIIRTGQPGLAPERFVIDHYDIDDYKDKTELTATHLYTSVRAALKSYRDLRTIDLNRLGLARVLAAAPDIYRISNRSLNEFCQGVLTQIIGLCNLSESSFISTIGGVIATFDEHHITIQATSGHQSVQERFAQIRAQCAESVLTGQLPEGLRKDAYVVPLLVQRAPVGFIYIEPTQDLSEADRGLISMVAQQCASALENLRLHIDLTQSYDHIIDMLAKVAEFKDHTTGSHIRRIDHYTRLLAVEMGINKDEAVLFGKASRLHDVGKVGIPDAILGKPGKLDAAEFDIVRSHTHIGGNILERDRFLAVACDVALHHHERWDAKGYPEGRPSREFGLITRIVSVVDVFDALVSRRPYKEPWEVATAAQEIEQGSGTQFDPTVVAAFLKLLRNGKFDPIISAAQHATDLPEPFEPESGDQVGTAA